MNSRKLSKEGLVVTRINPHKYVKALYSSKKQPTISHEDALEIINNQRKWEKLSLSEKLNVAKMYSSGIAKELDIQSVDVHLARYKGLANYTALGCAFSLGDGIALNISLMKTANNVKNTVAEEMRHIRQFYEMDGESDYKPKTILPANVVDYMKKSVTKFPNGWIRFSGDLKHDERPTEIDADKFVESYTVNTFGKYEACTPDSIYGKLSAFAGKLFSRMVMKYFDIKTRDLDQVAKVEMLYDIKSRNPEYKEVLQNRISSAIRKGSVPPEGRQSSKEMLAVMHKSRSKSTGKPHTKTTKSKNNSIEFLS